MGPDDFAARWQPRGARQRAPFGLLVDATTYRLVAARWAAQNFVFGGLAAIVGVPAILLTFGHLNGFRPAFVVSCGCALVAVGGLAGFLFRRSMRPALFLCGTVTSIVMAVFAYGAGPELAPAVAQATMMTAATAPLLYRRRNAVLILTGACATSGLAFATMPGLSHPVVRLMLLTTQITLFAALMFWLVNTLLKLAASERRALADTQIFREELFAADHRRRNFLHQMSHQLRTPLNAIIGFSEMLRSGLVGELSAKQQEYVADISSSGRHLLALVDDVLDVGQVEQGELELHPQPFPVERVAHESIALCRGQAQRGNVLLSSDVPITGAVLVADERKIRQVLLNLLSNAIKFTPAGGRARLEVELRGTSVVFRVSDSGPGIRPADAERIFRPYERGAGTKAPGTGLGLAVARRIAVAHGGELRFDGKGLDGRGSAFELVVPTEGRGPVNGSPGVSHELAAEQRSGTDDPGIFDDGSALGRLVGDEGLARLRSRVMAFGTIFESFALAATVPLGNLGSTLWAPLWFAVAGVGLVGGLVLLHPRIRLSSRTLYRFMMTAVAATGFHMWSFGPDLSRSLAVILVLYGMAAFTFFRTRRAMLLGTQIVLTYLLVELTQRHMAIGGLRMAVTLGIMAGGSMMARWLVRFLPTLANAEAMARREAEQVNLQLEAASRHKSEFLASMSHELRTPLNAIIGFVDALEHQIFGPLTDKQLEYVVDISVAGHHLLELIDDILDLARADAGRLDLRLEEASLDEILGLALGTGAGDVTVVAPVAADSVLRVDAHRLAQALKCLVDNAAEFSPAGEKVDVSVEMGQEDLLIRVADSGPSIPVSDQERIFAAFEQGSDRGSEVRNGLGLALSRHLVQLHGGTLTVTSRSGSGNVFTIALPRTETAIPGGFECAEAIG